jgi:allantoin racemase
MERQCRRVRAAEIAVLALEEAPEEAAALVDREVARAFAEDGAEAVLLGCAGMADLAGRLSAEFGMPVIDGVGAAVKLIEARVGLGLRTSKSCAYALPRPKPFDPS